MRRNRHLTSPALVAAWGILVGGCGGKAKPAAGQYSRKEIQELVIRIAARQANIDRSKLSPQTHFARDLKLSQAVRAAMFPAFEDVFNIVSPDADAARMQTVADAVEYVVSRSADRKGRQDMASPGGRVRPQGVQRLEGRALPAASAPANPLWPLAALQDVAGPAEAPPLVADGPVADAHVIDLLADAEGHAAVAQAQVPSSHAVG